MKTDVRIGIEVTLAIGCPNMCEACPQSTLLSKYEGPKVFTLESFKRCAESIPTTKHFTWMGFGEVWRCPDAVKIIRWAYERGHGMSISTTLRDATHQGIEALKDIPFTDTIVHVPDALGHMHLDPTPEWIELFKHAIEAWRHHPDFLISVFGPAHPKVLPVWLESKIPLVNFAYHDRAGLLKSFGQHGRNQGKLPLCGKIFNGHILPSGACIRCCNCYDLKNVWGNLNTQTYDEIFHSEAFKTYVKSMEDPNSEIPCRYCHDFFHQINVEDRLKTYDNPCN